MNKSLFKSTINYVSMQHREYTDSYECVQQPALFGAPRAQSLVDRLPITKSRRFLSAVSVCIHWPETWRGLRGPNGVIIMTWQINHLPIVACVWPLGEVTASNSRTLWPMLSSVGDCSVLTWVCVAACTAGKRAPLLHCFCWLWAVSLSRQPVYKGSTMAHHRKRNVL